MMNDQYSGREKHWQPQPRPDWVMKVNQEGIHLGPKNVVPLDENSLIATAKLNTGLSDFGCDSWYEPFKLLIKALEEEADLNLMGRLMTRSDLLLYLQARLQIEDVYKRHPEIEDEIIKQPLLIIGQGRSATSLLHNTLACDPNNRTPLTSEAYFPCSSEVGGNSATDFERGHQLWSQIERVAPELNSIHEMSGYLPAETSHLHCISFRSPGHFCGFGGQVPSYLAHFADNAQMLPALEYEKRILKLLQWQSGGKHWVLKAPYSLVYLPEIVKVYPDIGLVWTHRDPIKALSSMVNLLGTLFWSRSDNPALGRTVEMFSNPQQSAAMLNRAIEWIESGQLPRERLFNVQYQELVSDTLACIQSIYRYFGIDISDEGLESMQGYLDKNPRDARPTHQYSVGDSQRISEERKLYSPYQEYFAVPSEI